MVQEVEFKKDVERMCKWVLADIHRLMDVLDMPRGAGTKVLSSLHVFIVQNYLFRVYGAV